MKLWIAIPTILVFFALGIAFGGIIIQVDVDTCQQNLHDMCLYSNNITDLVNLQSGIIDKMLKTNSTILTKLDCFTT